MGKNLVTFWGSARFPCRDNEYLSKSSFRLSRRLASEADCMVATGGGPGIMEAGNRGAYEEGKPSLGLVTHFYEQNTNQYVTEDIPLFSSHE